MITVSVILWFLPSRSADRYLSDYIAIVTDRRAVFRKTGITSPAKEARLRLQRESEDNERNGGRARDNANARKRSNESLTNRDPIRRVGAILRIHLLR